MCAQVAERHCNNDRSFGEVPSVSFELGPGVFVAGRNNTFLRGDFSSHGSKKIVGEVSCVSDGVEVFCRPLPRPKDRLQVCVVSRGCFP